MVHLEDVVSCYYHHKTLEQNKIIFVIVIVISYQAEIVDGEFVLWDSNFFSIFFRAVVTSFTKLTNCNT